MTTPGDLRERFDRAAARVPVTPGDVDAVMARGRTRRRRRRAAGIASAVAVAVVTGTAVPQLLTGTPPVSIDPVEEVPTGSPGEEGVAGAVLAWDHSRYGPEGITRHTDPDRAPTPTWPEGVERAIGVPDGRVLAQREAGAAIVVLDGDGSSRELVPGDRSQRLLAAHEGSVWFTRRSDPGGAGEDEEQLLSVAIAGDDAITGHGVSAGVEGFTDALAFGPDDAVAWLSCHLQCRVLTGGLAAVVGEEDPRQLTAESRWYGALAYAPDGSSLAVVEGPDPVIGGTSDLVLLDPGDGRELARVPLEVPLELHAAAVSFTPDGRSVVVGDHLRALLVADVAGDVPSVEPLAGAGGVTLHVPQDGEPADEQPPSPDGPERLALTFADLELGWSDAVVEEVDETPTRPAGAGERTSVGLRRGPEAPLAVLSLSRDQPSDPWRITGGGHHAEEPDDPDGWWNSVQASDGTIRLGGRAPAWGGDRMTTWVLDGNGERTSSGPVEIDPDGTFEAVLEVPEQRDHAVTLLLVTLDAAGDVTSFAVLGIPPGEFAAG